MTTPTETVISGCTAWDTAAHEDLEAVDRARTEQWAREHRHHEQAEATEPRAAHTRDHEEPA